MSGEYNLEKVLSVWDIKFLKNHPKMDVSGSPQRSEFRTVIEDVNGEFYVVESVSKSQLDRKMLIAQTLFDLKSKQLYGVTPYLFSRNKKFIEHIDDAYWQIMSYLKGAVLERPNYIHDSWRGEALADFLVDLQNKILIFEWDEVFSLKDYVNEIASILKDNNPEIYTQILPVYNYLKKGLFKKYDQIPLSFCHGDFHPLNIIWGEDKIVSVIDWEFLGKKPELYDVANLVGCIGMENPEGLTGEFVTSFLGELVDAKYLSESSWDLLLDFVLATRFAWLSEWMRFEDKEMQDLEISYMNLLMALDSKILIPYADSLESKDVDYSLK